MPLYEYQCQSCGAIIEQLVKSRDKEPIVCPSCSKETLKRILSPCSMKMEGSGNLSNGPHVNSCPTGTCPFVKE